jgi:N-acetylneuraminic acid mutarotase
MRFLIAVFAMAMLVAPTRQAGLQIAAAPMGGWSDAGTLSTERGGGILGVLLGNGRVLVTGTSSDDYSGLGNVDLYDPGTGWSVGPKLQGDPDGAAMAPLPGGGALLVGGAPFYGGTDGAGPGPTATALVYDPSAGAWKKVPDMSSVRSGASASVLPDGRVLVAGGYDRRVVQLPNPTGQPMCCIDIQVLPLASTEIFNPTSSTWTPGPNLAHGRIDHKAVALKDGRILVVGGTDGLNPAQPLSTSELFDPAAGRWLSAGSIGAARTQFTLTALADGRALVAGGVTADGSAPLRSTLIYDPVANLWSPGPDLANARSGHAAALLPDGSVLVTGGADLLGRLASAELLNSAGTAWSPAGALPGARSDHFAVSLPNGHVLVLGGRGPSGALKTSVQYDPAVAGVAALDRAPAGPGRWRSVAATPLPTYLQSATLLADGRVLVLPSETYETFKAELYDPASDTWATPIERTSTGSSFAASALSSGKVLLLTFDQQGAGAARAELLDVNSGTAKPAASPGTGSDTRLDLLPDGRVWFTGGVGGGPQTQLYDPTADRWTAGPDTPTDLQMQTVTPLPDGQVLVGGVNKALVYNLASKLWTDAGTFPAYWSDYAAVRLPSGDVLLIGGVVYQTTSDGRMLQVNAFQMTRWNHATGLLGPIQSAPMAGANASTAVLADGTVLVAGGNPAVSGDPLPRAAIYHPATRSWSMAASLPVARAQAAAVTLADGRVLLAGGFGMFPGPPPSLMYTPQPSVAASAGTSSTTSVATMASIVITVVALLLAWQLVRITRRRNRSVGRPR